MIAALAKIYPEIERIVEQHVTPEGKALLAKMEKMTTAAAVFGLRNKDINDYIDMTMDEMWELPEVAHILEAMKLGTAGPTAPVLIVQAVNDKIIDVAAIDELVETYRAAGTSVTYHRDRFSEHLLLHTLSAPMTLRWLRDRFAGRPLSEHLSAHHLADDVQSLDLPWPAAIGRDHGEGGHRTRCRTSSAVEAGRRLTAETVSRPAQRVG